jgi:hypothetical protein
MASASCRPLIEAARCRFVRMLFCANDEARQSLFLKLSPREEPAPGLDAWVDDDSESSDHLIIVIANPQSGCGNPASTGLARHRLLPPGLRSGGRDDGLFRGVQRLLTGAALDGDCPRAGLWPDSWDRRDHLTEARADPAAWIGKVAGQESMRLGTSKQASLAWSGLITKAVAPTEVSPAVGMGNPPRSRAILLNRESASHG